MRETGVRSLGQEDPLEKEMAIHSSTIAWRIRWTEEPGKLQSMGPHRVGHDWSDLVVAVVYSRGNLTQHDAAQLLSRVQLSVTPWTVAHQDPLFMAFSRQEYWSGLPFPVPGDLPNPGIELSSLACSALVRWFFTTAPLGKLYNKQYICVYIRAYIFFDLKDQLEGTKMGEHM